VIASRPELQRYVWTMNPSRGMSRRAFVETVSIAATSALVGTALTACDASSSPALPQSREPGRLRVTPKAPTRTPTLGLQPIGLLPPTPALQRDGVLYVPLSYRASEPLPLVILLHGATGSGNAWFGSYDARAESARVIMLAPDSRAFTWDAAEDGVFGPDISFLEAAIGSVFDRCAIDANRMALIGFSDGGSYALSLGLANGDLFRHVVACSPGSVLTTTRHGHPRIYVTHGTDDAVLPIDGTSRQIVPALTAAGYDVRYREFEGGHELPLAESTTLMSWLSEGFTTTP
jgi:phospholipase/carboxylesterase